MDANKLMNEIKSGDEILIDILLNSILLSKRHIKIYEEMIEHSEKAYDLNTAADIKYNKIPEIEQKLAKEKTDLLKAIAESAYLVISKL